MENELPLVSVVTGYYNRKYGLKECIESILNQTYTNIEYIVFDDCSTDGTYEMLQQFTDPRLKLIRHPVNTGFTKGMVNAISQAKGSFIAVHGAGDRSAPERIEKEVEVLLNNEDVALVGCYYKNYYTTTGMEELITRKPRYDRDYLFINTPVSHGEVMYRKTQYDEVGGYNPMFKFVQDGDLWLRLTKLGYIYVIKEFLYTRMVFTDGVSYNTRKTIEQAKYSVLARELNKATPEKQAEMKAQFYESGIDSLIPYSNKTIQRKLVQKFHKVMDVHEPKDLVDFVTYSEGIYNLYFRSILFCCKFKPSKQLFHFLYYKMFKPLKGSLKR